MGKDQTDRESAVAKRYINPYVHASHNLLLADVNQGIMYLGEPENSKVSVIETDRTKARMTEGIIKNTQSYHSISFKKDVWLSINISIVGNGNLWTTSIKNFNLDLLSWTIWRMYQ